jgi:hypothetical protein
MSCRRLLRRVASRGVLPRERFSPLAQPGPTGTSAFAPVVGDQQTSSAPKGAPRGLERGARLPERCGGAGHAVTRPRQHVGGQKMLARLSN